VASISKQIDNACFDLQANGVEVKASISGKIPKRNYKIGCRTPQRQKII